MFCTKCGTTLTEDGVCPICDSVSDEITVDNGAPAGNPGKTLGIVSLILGIVSLVLGLPCSCACACLGSVLPFLCSVGGIVTGAIGMKKSSDAGLKNTMAIVGLILSIVAIVVCVLFVIMNGIIGGINGMNVAGNSNSFYNY